MTNFWDIAYWLTINPWQWVARKPTDDWFEAIYTNPDYYKYQIVTSVKFLNLKVALKNYLWQDPSVAVPVKVQIWDTVRTITWPLSITFDAWTNWFNLWSEELAFKEVDLFTYLIWDSTYSVVDLWFSRIPNWTSFNDFSYNTITSEKWISSYTWIATDKVVNIWRFNATLSNLPWYIWSIPANSVIINYPIFETRELDWLPTVSWKWSMTVTWNIVTQKYKVVWNKVFYKIEQLWLTTWWTASANIELTMPFFNILYSNWAAVVNDAWYKWSIFSNQVSSILSVSSSMSLSNWWLWENREIFGSWIITI